MRQESKEERAFKDAFRECVQNGKPGHRPTARELNIALGRNGGGDIDRLPGRFEKLRQRLIREAGL